jgi:hypothetical protein
MEDQSRSFGISHGHSSSFSISDGHSSRKETSYTMSESGRGSYTSRPVYASDEALARSDLRRAFSTARDVLGDDEAVDIILRELYRWP